MGGDLIREARRRAGLTQAQLAERAGTTQSAVARWERGRSAPSFDTVRRLVRACGFDLFVTIEEYDASDIAQAEQVLRLTTEERSDRLEQMVASFREFRAEALASMRHAG
ncbi:MAG: helix-turn-helix transcriptional regulator [Acidothermales bacterium]|jgi:transcriptional regulator with XRE-family HTH domain|nr:helix-turn-helix transcriptional regulator [Acidothermales bacterium]